MKDLKHYLWVLIILAVFSTPSLTEKVGKLMVWLVEINFEESPLSIVGQIICRVLAFAVSYSVVGVLFQWVGWFNGTAMRVAYILISFMASLVLSYIIMVIEQHTVLICVILAATSTFAIALIVIKRRNEQKKLAE